MAEQPTGGPIEKRGARHVKVSATPRAHLGAHPVRMTEHTGTDSIWGEQTVAQKPSIEKVGEKEKRVRQVTSADIKNDPKLAVHNPIIEASGFPVRNQGYSPGSEVMFTIPEGGSVQFLTEPVYDPKEGVHNWFVKGINANDQQIGVGTISTRNGRGAIITTKNHQKLTVFRPAFIIR